MWWALCTECRFADPQLDEAEAACSLARHEQATGHAGELSDEPPPPGSIPAAGPTAASEGPAVGFAFLLDRLHHLEAQVQRLTAAQTVLAREVVLADERHRVHARFELAGDAPQLVFFDVTGKPRLRLGLTGGGTPALWVDGREVPIEEAR